MSDPALDTLLLPFDNGLLPWPTSGRVLFLRARDGVPLYARARDAMLCEQSFKPDAEALTRAGFQVVADAGDAGTFPLVLLLPPRQRDEARALMARAIAQTEPGGRVVAAVSNNEGARSAQDDLARVAGTVASLSKHKCRVFWTPPLPGNADAALVAQWRGLDAARVLKGENVPEGFVSRPGVFAWDRIDPASLLLARHLPADLAGRAADLGAGTGFLTQQLLQRCAGIHSVDLFEAEARALDLARRNLASYAARAALGFHWHNVTTGVPGSYDVVVSNPPFHASGRADQPELGRRFISVAASILRPGGRLWLVANRHLPYEAELGAQFARVRTVAEGNGFKVFEAVRAS